MKSVITDEILKEVYKLIAMGVPKTRIAKNLGVNRSTLYRAIKRNSEKRNK